MLFFCEENNSDSNLITENGHSNISDDSSNNLKQIEPYVYLCFSCLNTVTTSFSAFLFFFRGRRELHRVLRRLLILLSLFEASFHSSVILTYALALILPPAYTSTQPLWMTLLYCHLRFSLTMRNWSVVVISWSRVEAVACPISMKKRTYFGGARIGLAVGILAAIAIPLSCLMQIAQERPHLLALCSDAKNTKVAVTVIENLFYTFQGVLPITMVIIATGITIFCLRRQSSIRGGLNAATHHRSPAIRLNSPQLGLIERRFVISSADDISSTGLTDRNVSRSPGPQTTSNSNQHSRREKQAMHIIIALSVTFAILECPTDIFGFVTLKTPLVELAVNILVELDSLGNFIIYTCCTKLFKNFWRSILYRQRAEINNTYRTVSITNGNTNCRLQQSSAL